VLEVLLEHVVLLNGHLFVTHGAHIVIVAVVNVRFILVMHTSFQSFPSSLRRQVLRDILGAFGFVKNSSLAFDSKVFAQCVEPL